MLPLKQPSDGLATGDSDGADGSTESGRIVSSSKPSDVPCTARILLAEDDLTNREVLLGMLELCGTSATVVGTGTGVLQALSQSPFDIISMDCFNHQII